ncbi:MAG: hypothetical protein GKR98_10625 [Boseongicola sp.]|nr:MAG: hypothetical protein GKR98_10625 [Boseongicola sp.]
MTTTCSRRALLAGLAAGIGSAAFAEAPVIGVRPKARNGALSAEPVKAVGDAVVARAGLKGRVAYAIADAETGQILDARLSEQPMPPASTLKAVTALYALDRLGDDYCFKTDIYVNGEVVEGRLEGDLVLAGRGDPTLDTDRLAELTIALKEAGITTVAGRFLVWSDALPRGDRIAHDQPEHVAYNPAFCGLNLNFNRVHFEWLPKGKEFELTMQAPGLKFRPDTKIARMTIVDRGAPVYDYQRGYNKDLWSVARGSLGKKKGARWLPVRFPALYAGDVFRLLN